MFDKSVMSQSLPGFGLKTETSERKRPIERQKKERNTSLFSLLMSVIMDKQMI